MPPTSPGASRHRLATLTQAAWPPCVAVAVVAALSAGSWLLAARSTRRDANAPPAVAPPLARVLQQYGIPVASQVLVFSKTSLQRIRIDESNPRAIYFNDHAAVAWVPGSSLLEAAVFDGTWPGVSFLTIDTSLPGSVPQRGDRCFQCHALPASGGLPGLLMRSAAPPTDGEAFRCLGDVDDRTPYAKRWGGWYVSGKRIPPGHAGRERPLAVTAGYPRSGSDVVALLVLGHQVAAVNLINLLARETRLAEDDARSGQRTEWTAFRQRVTALAEYLLFLDEVPLPSPIQGDAEFSQVFEAAGVLDAHGHSLRVLDLQHRLFRIPCSFMIHSPAFRALPASARQAVYARMSELLAGRVDPRVGARVSAADRDAIVHILRETIADLPAGFGQPASGS